VRKITAKVALPKDYVDGKLWVEVGDSEATVSTNKRGTLMSRYEHTPAPGRGYSVRLHTGKAPVHFRHVFMVPLRRGKIDGGNGQSLAERIGNSRRVHVLHAGSPSQVMEAEMDDIEKEVQEVLDTEIRTALESLQNEDTPRAADS
jgi:hypothetical protein